MRTSHATSIITTPRRRVRTQTRKHQKPAEPPTLNLPSTATFVEASSASSTRSNENLTRELFDVFPSGHIFSDRCAV